MEVILKEDIPNLGHADELVKVKDGYGRNYLIPKGLAIIASPSAKKSHEEVLRQRQHKEERLREAANETAEQLKLKKLKIGAKTSTTGKIFGSVNTIQLAEEIARKGFEIERKNISIVEDAIKEVGTYHVKIKIYKDVAIEMPFEVVAE